MSYLEIGLQALDGFRARICQPAELVAAGLTTRPTAEQVAAMSLDEFARAGLKVRVYSAVLHGEVLFVSDDVPDSEVESEELPVYRAHELWKLSLLRQPADLRRLHEVKDVFKGTILAIEDRHDQGRNHE